ncbi:MAG: enoyl-CoA hydratase-related protein [Vicinamibacterales bacterium]
MSAPFATAIVHDGVLSLRIATDDEPHMDLRWSQRLAAALDGIGRDATVRVVVLEGGARVFCAGASRDALLTRRDVPSEYAAQVSRALLATPLPIVAALAGHAIGGGLLVGLWCDAAVLAAESLYGANFMALGFTPGMGATAAVPDAFGPVLGRRLLFTGQCLTGREIRAAGCPLSHAVHARREVRDRAIALAAEMADAPRPALVLLKQTLAARRQVTLERALEAERHDHAELFADDRTFDEIGRRYLDTDRLPGTPE